MFHGAMRSCFHSFCVDFAASTNEHGAGVVNTHDMYGCVVRVKPGSLTSNSRSIVSEGAQQPILHTRLEFRSSTTGSASVARQEVCPDSRSDAQPDAPPDVATASNVASAVIADKSTIGTLEMGQVSGRVAKVLCGGDTWREAAHPDTAHYSSGCVALERLQQRVKSSAGGGVSASGVVGRTGSPASPPFPELSTVCQRQGHGVQVPSDRWDGWSKPQVLMLLSCS